MCACVDVYVCVCAYIHIQFYAEDLGLTIIDHVKFMPIKCHIYVIRSDGFISSDHVVFIAIRSDLFLQIMSDLYHQIMSGMFHQIISYL